MRVLVTGASGFVGSALIETLREATDFEPIAAVRSGVPVRQLGVRYVNGFEMLDPETWVGALEGVDAVVHAAARVHILCENSRDPFGEYRRVNVEASLELAQSAFDAGAKRFIFISSVKVNGEATRPGQPFTASDVPAPGTPYGASKHEAERALSKLCRQIGLELVIIRPPLVYGPGVKANFQEMMSLLRRGLPLPVGALNARRSLVAIENLTDLIVRSLQHPDAPGNVLMVSDGVDMTVSEIFRQLRSALHSRALLVPVPSGFVLAAGRAAGKGAAAERLCSGLQVDIQETAAVLNWNPPFRAEDCFRRTAEDFLATDAR